MNYGEDLAYWYFRLNGFFPITDFVIHREGDILYPSDSDILAIRLPHAYEDIGGKYDDYDDRLFGQIDKNRIIGLMCEVKTGDYDRSRLFPDNNVRCSFKRLGLIPYDRIDEDVQARLQQPILEIENDRLFCKILISSIPCKDDHFISMELNDIEEFIINRIRRYPQEKHGERIFFNSILFQYLTHRVKNEG
jgi:hypothetical protein